MNESLKECLNDKNHSCWLLLEQVWNLLNGLNLHKLEPVTNSEVTGLTCLHDNQLLAVGWSRQIVQYDIAAAKVILKVP